MALVGSVAQYETRGYPQQTDGIIWSAQNGNKRGEENTRRKEKLPQLTPLNFQLLNNLITSAVEAEEEDVVSWTIIKMKMAEKMQN